MQPLPIVRVLRRCALIVTALIATAWGAGADDRALIIGINKYPHVPNRQLTGAVNDARAMERLAREVWGFKPDQIRLLLDEQATSSAILGEMETWLVGGTKPGDRVLFYYSGHGYYVFAPDMPQDEAWRETIAPHDVWPIEATYSNMIVDLEIKRRLDQMADRTIMFIADSCHSGTVWRNVDALVDDKPSIVRSLGHQSTEPKPPVFRSSTPADFDAKYGRRRFVTPSDQLIAWSAVQATELAEEDMELPPGQRHGVFTRRFIEGLRERKADANDDGIVTVAELFIYVTGKSTQYCVEHYCRSHRMTPMIEAPNRLIGSDLLAWRPRGEPKPTATRLRFDPTNILPANNAGELKLELLPGSDVRLGGEIKLRLTSTKAGWLIVLDVRDDGRVVQLFPSKCARPERRIRAGATLTLPDLSYGCVFEATELGSGQILAIVTEDNVPVADLLGRHRDLDIVPYGEDYLAEIAQRLMAAWDKDEKGDSRPIRWSLMRAKYSIRQ